MRPETIKPYGMIFELAGLVGFGVIAYKVSTYILEAVLGDFIADTKSEVAGFFILSLHMIPLFAIMLIGVHLSVFLWVFLVAKFSGLSRLETILSLEKASENSVLNQSGVGFGFYIWCCNKIVWSQI